MPDEISDIDLDELIDVLPDDEVDALLRDLDLGDFEKEKTEDADLVKHGDNDRVDPAKSRAAKKRYQQNRETYRKAFDKFRRSSRGKLFYNKLSRFSQRPSSIMKRETESVDTLIDQVLAGTNIGTVVNNSLKEYVDKDTFKKANKSMQVYAIAEFLNGLHIGKTHFIGDLPGGKPAIRGMNSDNSFMDKAALGKFTQQLNKMYDLNSSVGTDAKGAFLTF